MWLIVGDHSSHRVITNLVLSLHVSQISSWKFQTREVRKKRVLLGNAETKTPQRQKLIFRRKEVNLVTAWPIWYVITEHHGVAFFYLLLLVRQNFHKFLLPQGINNSHNNYVKLEYQKLYLSYNNSIFQPLALLCSSFTYIVSKSRRQYMLVLMHVFSRHRVSHL